MVTPAPATPMVEYPPIEPVEPPIVAPEPAPLSRAAGSATSAGRNDDARDVRATGGVGRNARAPRAALRSSTIRNASAGRCAARGHGGDPVAQPAAYRRQPRAARRALYVGEELAAGRPEGVAATRQCREEQSRLAGHQAGRSRAAGADFGAPARGEGRAAEGRRRDPEARGVAGHGTQPVAGSHSQRRRRRRLEAVPAAAAAAVAVVVAAAAVSGHAKRREGRQCRQAISCWSTTIRIC